MIKTIVSKFEPFVWSIYSLFGWDDRITTKAYQEQIISVTKMLVKEKNLLMK